MATKVQHHRRRPFLGILAVACLLLALGVGLGVAGAATSKPVTVGYVDGGSNCGTIPGPPYIGTATFTRNDGRMMVASNLRGASSNDVYVIYLYDYDTCDPIAKLGKIATNGKGNGSGTFQTNKAGGHSNFFATAYNGGYNDTTSVNMPGHP